MSRVVYTDMTKSEFISKIGNELWKFVGRCREKAKELRFFKTRNGFRLYIKAESGWYKIFIGKNYIRFVYGKFRYFADSRIKYYRWVSTDDHKDVIAYFAADLKRYYKAMFPNKNDDSIYFHHNLQSYRMQKYMDRICED